MSITAIASAIVLAAVVVLIGLVLLWLELHCDFDLSQINKPTKRRDWSDR